MSIVSTENGLASGELLLRRALPSFHPERKPGELPPTWTDFRPTREDKEGLSVTRRKFVDDLATEASARSGKPRALAQFVVQNALDLGLSVVANPVEGSPGHALIPEMNRCDYEGSNKKKIKEWAMSLAERSILVFNPPSS